MKNIEIKCRLRRNFESKKWLKKLTLRGKIPLKISQEDTYFNVRYGRLKLRRQGSQAQLIYYQRADLKKGRVSSYEIIPINDAAKTKKFLAQSLGTAGIVRKKREVYFWKNVRLHLDQIHGLGKFLEIESAISHDIALKQARKNFNTVLEAIPRNTIEPVDCSYLDLILRP
ncbi:MAG: class IV adenylate cyclase [Elusimicrobia bacterium]|nr:class IV adenylate cyclase [Elusimicrobiota bacterium]